MTAGGESQRWLSAGVGCKTMNAPITSGQPASRKRPTGSMNLSSTHLSVVNDKGSAQLVMR